MRIPKYRKNGDGRAFVEWRKRRYYLGTHGTADSRHQYADFIHKLESHEPPVQIAGPTIAALVDAYLEFARAYYSKDGKPSKESRNMEHALLPLTRLLGSVPALDFGPLKLEQYQKWMVKQEYARGVINARVGRVKRMLRWCVKKELIPVSIYEAAKTVDGLRAGSLGIVESEPVKPVPHQHVVALLPFVNRQVAAMVATQYFCGMRSQDVTRMRPCDIDRIGKVWLYKPESHKSAHLGQSLIKAIPKQAQKILKPFLDRESTEYMFSPRDAEEERREKAKHKRKRKRSRKNSRYSTDTYAQAIRHGIKKAAKAGVNIPDWHPHQLRHAIATDIAQRLGPTSAQSWLGHSELDSTSIYVERQQSELVKIAESIGRLPLEDAQSQHEREQKKRRSSQSKTRQPRRKK